MSFPLPWEVLVGLGGAVLLHVVLILTDDVGPTWVDALFYVSASQWVLLTVDSWKCVYAGSVCSPPTLFDVVAGVAALGVMVVTFGLSLLVHTVDIRKDGE